MGHRASAKLYVGVPYRVEDHLMVGDMDIFECSEEAEGSGILVHGSDWDNNLTPLNLEKIQNKIKEATTEMERCLPGHEIALYLSCDYS